MMLSGVNINRGKYVLLKYICKGLMLSRYILSTCIHVCAASSALVYIVRG